MNRDFKGIWIPAAVWLDPNLSAIQKVLLAEVDSFTSREQDYFKSNDTICQELGCSLSTVKRSVTHLIELGYISRVSFDGRKRALRSNLSQADRSKRSGSRLRWTGQPVQIDPAEGSKRTKSKTKREPKKDTSISMPFPDFDQIWDGWKQYRKEEHGFQYKSANTEQVALKKLQDISNHDRETACAIIEQSVSNGWKGLFPIKSTAGKRAAEDGGSFKKFEQYIKTGTF